MGTLEELLKRLTELKPNSSLHLPSASLILVFFVNKLLETEGFEKVEGIDASPLYIDYKGPIDILRVGDNYRITSSETGQFKVLAEVTGNWSLKKNYISTTVPDVPDEAPELRIYNTN